MYLCKLPVIVSIYRIQSTTVGNGALFGHIVFKRGFIWVYSQSVGFGIFESWPSQSITEKADGRGKLFTMWDIGNKDRTEGAV